MNLKVKKWLVLVFGVLFAAVTLTACTAGEEQEKVFLAKAQKGDAEAQFELGDIYLSGNGVDQSDKKGLLWVRRSADQGFARAQHYMGEAYTNGVGLILKKNTVEACKWLTLAANQEHGPATRSMKDLQEKMTPQEIEQAKKLAQDWKPKKE